MSKSSRSLDSDCLLAIIERLNSINENYAHLCDHLIEELRQYKSVEDEEERLIEINMELK